MATSKNLLKSRDQYNRYYGDFRGVDFSSDHTQVNERRLAYSVNMYKDYQSGQGQALETIAGFRRRVSLPEGKEVYGIHHYNHKNEDGNIETIVLIHSGDKLYRWYNYPNTIGVTNKMRIELPAHSNTVQSLKVFRVVLGSNVSKVTGVLSSRNEQLTFDYNTDENLLRVYSSVVSEGDAVIVSYVEGSLTVNDAVFSEMNEKRSTSFIFNNRLYIIDGKNYLVYDGEKISEVSAEAYVPTTYINIIPSGENADNGTEYEQRNILSPFFKHTFIADGETKEFFLNDNELEAVTEVKVYDTVADSSTYTVDLLGGKITFNTAPIKPEEAVHIKGENGAEDVHYPEFHAGIEITAKKPIKAISGIVEDTVEIENIITACTIAVIYDNRVFLSGNPKHPNHVFYCGRNNTGYLDPTYFGILNYMQDGVGITPITGMIPVADSLMVLKGDTQQDGSVFFHTPMETTVDVQPITYPSTQGLAGTGCLGACTNFLDDPVFVSRFGLEAIGQLSVRYERAVEHRSSLVDAKLANMDLTKATLEEWNGYLLVLIDGKVFMADSRQRYTHDDSMQYEWYYLEDIGVYEGQYPEYKYTSQEIDLLEGKTVKYEVDGQLIDIPLVVAKAVKNADNGDIEDLRGKTANEPNENGAESSEIFYETLNVYVEGDEEEEGYSIDIGVYYKVHEIYDFINDKVEGYEALICDSIGAYTGGVFRSAKLMKSMENNLFFGTENGVVCSFNFDMRNEDGEIAPKWYTFDDRAILCGCATRMDNCGIPHLTKTTIKKSTVVKTKAFKDSAAKIKVRTNKKVYEQIARINSSVFSFDDMDFADFSFNTEGQSLFSVREKEKKWVEKQYYVYSDEYQKPFALYYISFRYKIAGRYKE